MIPSRGASRAMFTTLALFVATTIAQGCYYPDGITLSNDVPCSQDGSQTSCCGAQAFCLNNGLCYGNGLVSRGSCTDKTWADPACPSYCTTEHKSEGIILTPCSSSGNTNTFACGLNNSRCASNSSTFVVQGGSGLILRPSQLAQLVQPALASASLLPGSADKFTVGQLAGTAAGIAVPLLIALGIAVFMLIRERRKNSPEPPRDTQIKDDKGYKTLHPDLSSFSPPVPLQSGQSTPGFPQPPGYLSQAPSPGMHPSQNPMGLSSPPQPSYSSTTSPIHAPGQTESFVLSRPPSSRGSARHSIFPSTAPTPAMPTHSPNPGNAPRSLALPNLNSRESVRSQNSVSSSVASPQTSHAPTLGEQEDGSQPQPSLRVATVQQITIAARPPNPQRQLSNPDANVRQQGPHPQQQQNAAMQNYQRNMAQQYASAMEQYQPHYGRAELDSAENRVVRHELGDGRKSWVKQ